MNVSSHLEKASNYFSRWVDERLSTFGFLDVSYGRLNTQEQVWVEIPMNLDWFCRTFEMDLEKFLVQRTQEGVHHWDKLDSSHQKFMDSIEMDLGYEAKRVTVATSDESSREYLTVTYRNSLSLKDYMMLYQILSALSFEANKLSGQTHLNLFLN